MKTTLVLLTSLFLIASAFADQNVSVYKPTAAGSTTRGCSQVVFIMQGVFTGTIGNATFSTAASTQTVIPISAVGSGQMLGAIPYTIAGAGSLIIIETK